MFTKISRVWYLITHISLLRILLSLPWNGYLKDTGWINSFIQQKSLDSDGKPIPWISYPCIEFIQNRLNKNLTIFEYGSGYSTLFYADRVSDVISVEHDEDWYLKIKSTIPENVNLHFCELIYGGQYSQFITTIDRSFDVVIIDGRDRVNCINNSINSLSDTGVIILDNSEIIDYKPGIDFLINNGFRRLDFWGIAPGYNHKTCTTIFYKSNNCLGI